ncbi:MAG: hypothetical protein WBA57_17530 [Elainellaceae cyanobacterium]
MDNALGLVLGCADWALATAAARPLKACRRKAKSLVRNGCDLLRRTFCDRSEIIPICM